MTSAGPPDPTPAEPAEPAEPADDPADPDERAAQEPDQVWAQVLEGRSHRVEASGTVRHAVRWLVDGVEVATATSAQEKVRVEVTFETEKEPAEERSDLGGQSDSDPSDDTVPGDLGHLQVVFSTLGAPRRATLHPAGAAAARTALGAGGTDLQPAPGSPAAAYEQRVRDHPTRMALIAGASGVVKVLLPFAATAMLVLLARWVVPLLPDLPSIPWPDLPSVPFPDLPSIPWPDLSSIPFPDLPRFEVTVPAWLRWVLDRSQYVLPVVIALVLARREVRRRRAQDALREQASPPQGPSDEPRDRPGDQP